MPHSAVNSLASARRFLHRALRPFVLVVCLIVGSAGRSAPGPSTRNPLDLTFATTCDQKSAGIEREAPPSSTPATSGAAHLANVHDGDFALYRAFDFDSGVAAFRATVAGPRPGTLEVHLDSPTGPLLVACPFGPSGSWDHWQDITANVDHAQAGVRDVYLLFRAPPNAPPNPRALVNLRSFVFLKSVVTPSAGSPDLASRVDSPDDGEPPNSIAWDTLGQHSNHLDALPNGDDWRSHWRNLGDLHRSTDHGADQGHAVTSGAQPLFAYAADAYIDKTDTGGEWRTRAEGSVSTTLLGRTTASRPGIGFASSDGRQGIYVTLNFTDNCLEAWRKLADGTVTLIRRFPEKPGDPLPNTVQPYVQGGRAGSPGLLVTPPRTWTLHPNQLYDLELTWSPYSDALLVYLGTFSEPIKTNFRTVIDLPAARRPLLVNSGGPADLGQIFAFGPLTFSKKSDAWNYRWEWLKQPVLTPDVCNPAVWRGPNGQMYMMWRKFGADNFHGIAKSEDGVHWTRVTDQAIRCTGDMTVLQDPFGDGKWYATPGGNNLPWWTSDGTDDFQHWTQTGKTVGDIHGHNRIQEIIDTQRYPQLQPIHFDGQNYRFIAYCEDWVHAPQPHSVVLLSNTLTDWVQPSADPVVPPSDDFWGEKGNAIGSAFPLPDGNILLSVCACTNAGYTGAPEPTNITAIASGTEPWRLLKKATLPDAPVSRENVWYQGPNFGTAFFYDEKQDTLFYYGGFHDYSIGVMRVRNFLHPQ